MPRPSDFYATMGAPGMYQASPPASPQEEYHLPDVYVVPPDDDEDPTMYCLFRGGPASASTYITFYDSRPSSPEFGHELYRHESSHGSRMLRHRSSLFYTSMSEASASGRSSIELEGEEDELTEDSFEGRTASRRSSVFGDRPIEVVDQKSEVAVTEKKTGSLRRAFNTLMRIGGGGAGNSSKQKEVQQPQGNGEVVEYESWFEMDRPTTSKRARKALSQLFGGSNDRTSSVRSTGSSYIVPLPVSSVPTLSRRKSVSQFLGLKGKGTSKQEAPRQRAASTSASTEDVTKLTKRPSISRLWGRGRSRTVTAKEDSPPDSRQLPVPSADDDPTPVRRRALSSPVARTESYPRRPESPASFASTARPIEGLDDASSSVEQTTKEEQAQSPSPDKAIGSEIPKSPEDALCDKRDSVTDSLSACSERAQTPSSAVRSSDSLTLEDDPQSPIPLDIPAIVVSCDDDDDDVELIDDDFYPKGTPMELQDDRHVPSNVVQRPMTVDDPPMMDLALHLNSLSSDRLTFDHDAFEDAISVASSSSN